MAPIEFAQLGPAVDLRPLFAPQRVQLCGVLDDLSVEAWQRPTACVGWTVADIARHVLGDLLGRLGAMRDGGRAKGPRDGEGIGAFIDRINDEWVVGARQLSPALVVDLLRWAGPVHDDLWRRRPLDEPSLGVSWAGADPSPLWLDAARDVSEYWLHEWQIRSALGLPDPALPDVATMLDVFARGLPYTLGLRPRAFSSLLVNVDEDGPAWTLRRDHDRWWLAGGPATETDFSVHFDGARLWRRWSRQPDAGPPPDDEIARIVWDHVAIVHSAPV